MVSTKVVDNSESNFESNIAKRRFEVDDEDYQVEGSSPTDSKPGLTKPAGSIEVNLNPLNVTVSPNSVTVLLPTLFSILCLL